MFSVGSKLFVYDKLKAFVREMEMIAELEFILIQSSVLCAVAILRRPERVRVACTLKFSSE